MQNLITQAPIKNNIKTVVYMRVGSKKQISEEVLFPRKKDFRTKEMKTWSNAN